jgi:protein-L-isoaspartate(D-aspartate) O-methyltransferase
MGRKIIPREASGHGILKFPIWPNGRKHKPGQNDDQTYAKARERMVTEQLVARGISDERVLEAMQRVPRHLFVEEALRFQAYGDHALPIGEGQTISQPFIVALTCQTLSLKGTERVLEIGTGSGYQAAILAELVEKVYTIERLKGLGADAREVLDSLSYHNVVGRISDGTLGWPEESPFDAIVIAACAPEIPAPMKDQLAEGGRMVVPVGEVDEQVLLRVTKTAGKFEVEGLSGCVFVRLIGKHGWAA